MKIFYSWMIFVLVIFLIYVGYALPFLNENKGAELWGQENRWVWYAQFCFKHFLFCLIPIAAGGVLIYFLKGVFSNADK